MKILSWNVGGAHLFDGRTEDGKSYGNEDINYFSEAVQKTDAMVVALQETPDPFDEKDSSFSEIVGKKSKYTVSGDFHYGKSHIKEGNWHSLATLSRGNISNVQFYQLPNPNLKRYWENGDVWVTFDVGFLSCISKIDNMDVHILNCHLVPFHYFERDVMDSEFNFVRNAISDYVVQYKDEPTLILGDFNYNNLEKMIPEVFNKGGFKEVFTGIETAPGRGQQDHILFSKHWKLNGYEIRKLQADHYQCIADIDLL